MLKKASQLAAAHVLAVTGLAYFAGVFSGRVGVLQFFGHLGPAMLFASAGLTSMSRTLDMRRLIQIEAYLALGAASLYILVDTFIMHPPLGVFDGAGRAELQHVSLNLMLLGLAAFVLVTTRYTEVLPSIGARIVYSMGSEMNKAKRALTRRLSAIMFTDMVGFTALMQDDEHRAKSIRDRHREVLRQSIESHGGEIVQFYGDGTLSVFASAIEAVSSAVAAQRTLQQAPSIPVRIGLHIGDINRDEHGVYGDGVNVAARIQGLSVAGAVMISGKVFDEIKNHPELPATALGEFVLKNVRLPVRVFAVAAPGLVVPDAKSIVTQAEPGGETGRLG